MRDPEESDLMRHSPPDGPWQRVTPIRGNAAKLRRARYGPVTARYLAILAGLEDARVQLAFAIDAIVPGDRDGVVERHAVDLVGQACERVRTIICRQAMTEARRIINGRRRPRTAPPAATAAARSGGAIGAP